MDEETKYDIMCVERGDVEYLRNIAVMLMDNDSQLHDQAENISKAILGIVNAAYEFPKC